MTPVVVLLHGLLRSARSMATLARALEAGGHEVWARDYASQRLAIDESACEIAGDLRTRYGTRPIVFITHSLGGVVARYIAGPYREALRVDRILMLAPPNGGSRVAQRLGALRVFQRIYGPAGQQLRVADASSWPAPTVPVAVIAGTSAIGMNPVGWVTRAAGLIRASEPSDGTVLVEETRLSGMVDFATVAATHTFIMDHPEVHRMALHFVGSGKLR